MAPAGKARRRAGDGCARQGGRGKTLRRPRTDCQFGDGLTLRVELENGDCSFEFEGDNIVIEGQQYVAENLGSLKGYIEELAFGGEASGEKSGNIQADITGPDDAAGI